MSKFTPGPWGFVGFLKYPNKKRGHLVHAQAGKDIARVPIESWNEEEQAANARLIASAPELLEACKFAEKTFRKVSTPEEEIDALELLRMAIAKAEGKEEGNERGN